MDKLIATTPLGGFTRHFGDTTLSEVTGLALVSLACPLGGDDALAAGLETGYALTRPTPGTSTVSGETRLIWTAPDQMLLALPHDAPDAAQIVGAAISGSAYVTDQTDNWCALELSGPRARAALERVCPVDLHPHAFALGAAARTVMEHMGALVIRTGEDRFLLLSASSSAGSFLHAVEQSVANVS